MPYFYFLLPENAIKSSPFISDTMYKDSLLNSVINCVQKYEDILNYKVMEVDIYAVQSSRG
jgi:hypothetical protein